MTNQILDQSNQHSEISLHVVLATFPQTHERIFNKSIVESFYGNYRDNSKKYLHKDDDSYMYCEERMVKVLYTPLRYYILGNYDMAYISLIDNFKFAQRVFEPQLHTQDGVEPQLFSPHTFQSFSGITCESGENLKIFFSKSLKTNGRYFLAITNLKLNNGFLIGNGTAFLDSASNMIKRKIAEFNCSLGSSKEHVEFQLMQSFSWFELSLVLFADRPEHLSAILKILRGCAISEVDDYESIINQSLYNSIFSEEEKDSAIDKANVFADTHTDFGLNALLVEESPSSDYLKEFSDKKIELNTEVEWQVKPGHMHLLLPLLKMHLPDVFVYDDRFLLAGKNDYLIKIKSNLIQTNISLLRLVLTKGIGLYRHVRKIKTRVYFKDSNSEKEDTDRKVMDLHSKLVSLGVKIGDFTELDRKLKSLKISRQIRSKIFKIFSNYNNGIQDIVLFPFFMDFKIFIDELINIITAPADRLDAKFAEPGIFIPDLRVSELEHTLMKMINIFQEGYNIRMLNGYQFEDIYDFDLDFNSSIQQLLSVYSMLAIETGNLFYEEEYKYGPVVQLNLKDTVSNYMSINYYVHHLTSPEFIFATITKEIFNVLNIDSPQLELILENYQVEIKKYRCNSSYLQELIESNFINFSYLVNDALRFVITFDLDFKLFNFWHWTYNLQNASLYDETGIVNEYHFKDELIRVLFVNYFFGGKLDDIECPLPELFTLWERHFHKLAVAVEEFCKFLEQSETNLVGAIMDHIQAKLNHSLSYCEREFEFESDDPSSGILFMLKLQKKYQCSYFSQDLVASISRKHEIFKLLDQKYTKDERTNQEIPIDSMFYFQWYMLDYLKLIYKLNGGRAHLLRRNWYNGKPLQCFLGIERPDYLYSVDQTGGLFFDDIKSLNKYFQLSSKVIKDMWNFSQLRKKKFMTKILPTIDA